MLKCSFCGHENEDGQKFCDNCKTDLSVPAPATAHGFTSVPFAGSQAGTIDAGRPDGDIQTLHLDKVPLVESLGARAAVGSEMTRPATPVAEKIQAAIPTLSAAPGGAADPSSPKSDSVPGLKPYLVVLRGEKIDMNYPIYGGKNYMGRTDDKPVDIDLECQEPADRIWTSRQHAVINFENGSLTIEDLNSLNGTFVNRTRVHPGQVRTLQANDIIQVGTVQLRLQLG